MQNNKRARIFMPFAALKGFEEAIAKQERIIVDKKELSEDGQEELDYKLKQIKKNMMIEIIYFEDGQYIKINGMVSKIDVDNHYLMVVKTKILFANIREIKGEDIQELY